MGYIPTDWQEVNLEDVAEIRGRIGWKGLKQEEYTKEGPYLIAGKHIKSPHVLWEKCDHISMERYEESMEIALQVNDIIFSKDGTLGNPAFIDYLPDKATINSTMMLVRPNEAKIYPKFLYHILNSQQFDQLVKEKTSGSSIPHIFQRDMKKFKLQVPSKKEQEKIAAILSTWDSAIELKEKLIEFKKTIRKGLMKELLSGKIQFPGFKGQWKTVALGDIAEIYQPKMISQSALKESGYPVYGANGLIGFYDQYNHETWQIMITCRGSTCGMVNKTEGKAWITGNAMVVNVDKTPTIDKDYMYYLCLAQDYKKIIGGSGQPQITKKPLEEFKVTIPEDIKEQRQIAQILQLADKEIKLLEKELARIKKQKQGLMQLLLTGKIRV